MARARVPLTLGAGLDRGTGAGARDARTLFDARNVVAREAGLELRAGLGATGLPALDWGTDVLLSESVEATRDVLQVVYDRPTRVLRVYRVNPAGNTRQLVGAWGTALHAEAQFPVVTMAEQDGVVYLAHAEPTFVHRQSTVRWTKGALDTDAGTLTVAEADLDGNGTPAPLKFYGVVAYETYIVGWGYGSEATGEGDRPEIVRVTKPDDPLAWPGQNFFLAGSRSARVEACLPMPGGLCARTRHTGYVIFGTDPTSFGIRLSDTTAGCVSPRAWAVVDGVAYVWATSGPRILRDPGSASEDVALPLDLAQPWPAGWPARGPEREAFAAYDPEQRVLYWAWPDLTAAGRTDTLVFAQSLRASAPRFTGAVFQRRVACAGRYLTGKVPPPPATGYATSTAVTESAGTSGRRTLTVTWTNTSAAGTETAEVWVREAGGTWALAATQAVSGATGTAVVPGYIALTAYEVAVRLRSVSNTFPTGYVGDTPNDWTAGTVAGSKATVTTQATVPAVSGSTWARTSPTTHRLTVAVAVAHGGVSLEVERYDGAAWQPVLTTPVAAAQTVQVPYEVVEAVGATVPVRARLVNGAATTAWSATANVVTGVTLAGPELVWLYNAAVPGLGRLELLFPDYDAGPLDFEEVGVGPIAPMRDTTWLGTLARVFLPLATTGPATVNVRARRGVTAFGVTDWGPWGPTATRFVAAGASPLATPETDQFLVPYGDFEFAGGGPARPFPRTFTPLDVLPALTRLWVVFQTSSGLLVRGPFTASDYEVPQGTGAPGDTYFAAIAWLDQDGGNFVRSQILDLNTLTAFLVTTTSMGGGA